MIEISDLEETKLNQFVEVIELNLSLMIIFLDELILSQQ